jgi:2-polyprenyl-3-methyl-5-hydroxy-6-metoxy-1,4-benzoquinol methylase
MNDFKKIVLKLYNKINVVRVIIKNQFSLSDEGERVDIIYKPNANFDTFDIYQKSHFRRYEYALKNINKGDVVADLACGTGYGSAMLSSKAKSVLGIDLNARVIDSIKKRYRNIPNISFLASNLLDLSYDHIFDCIVAFETIEHLKEEEILKLFSIFNKALKPSGKFIFSVPFMQEKSETAIKMGFHLTFNIDENKINLWLANAGFNLISFKYQNYKTHNIIDSLKEKDFIICIAKKNET